MNWNYRAICASKCIGVHNSPISIKFRSILAVCQYTSITKRHGILLIMQFSSKIKHRAQYFYNARKFAILCIIGVFFAIYVYFLQQCCMRDLSEQMQNFIRVLFILIPRLATVVDHSGYFCNYHMIWKPFWFMIVTIYIQKYLIWLVNEYSRSESNWKWFVLLKLSMSNFYYITSLWMIFKTVALNRRILTYFSYIIELINYVINSLSDDLQIW